MGNSSSGTDGSFSNYEQKLNKQIETELDSLVPESSEDSDVADGEARLGIELETLNLSEESFHEDSDSDFEIAESELNVEEDEDFSLDFSNDLSLEESPEDDMESLTELSLGSVNLSAASLLAEVVDIGELCKDYYYSIYQLERMLKKPGTTDLTTLLNDIPRESFWMIEDEATFSTLRQAIGDMCEKERAHEPIERAIEYVVNNLLALHGWAPRAYSNEFFDHLEYEIKTCRTKLTVKPVTVDISIANLVDMDKIAFSKDVFGITGNLYTAVNTILFDMGNLDQTTVIHKDQLVGELSKMATAKGLSKVTVADALTMFFDVILSQEVIDASGISVDDYTQFSSGESFRRYLLKELDDGNVILDGIQQITSFQDVITFLVNGAKEDCTALSMCLLLAIITRYGYIGSDKNAFESLLYSIFSYLKTAREYPVKIHIEPYAEVEVATEEVKDDGSPLEYNLTYYHNGNAYSVPSSDILCYVYGDGQKAVYRIPVCLMDNVSGRMVVPPGKIVRELVARGDVVKAHLPGPCNFSYVPSLKLIQDAGVSVSNQIANQCANYTSIAPADSELLNCVNTFDAAFVNDLNDTPCEHSVIDATDGKRYNCVKVEKDVFRLVSIQDAGDTCPVEVDNGRVLFDEKTGDLTVNYHGQGRMQTLLLTKNDYEETILPADVNEDGNAPLLTEYVWEDGSSITFEEKLKALKAKVEKGKIVEDKTAVDASANLSANGSTGAGTNTSANGSAGAGANTKQESKLTEEQKAQLEEELLEQTAQAELELAAKRSCGLATLSFSTELQHAQLVISNCFYHLLCMDDFYKLTCSKLLEEFQQLIEEENGHISKVNFESMKSCFEQICGEKDSPLCSADSWEPSMKGKFNDWVKKVKYTPKDLLSKWKKLDRDVLAAQVISHSQPEGQSNALEIYKALRYIPCLREWLYGLELRMILMDAISKLGDNLEPLFLTAFKAKNVFNADCDVSSKFTPSAFHCKVSKGCKFMQLASEVSRVTSYSVSAAETRAIMTHDFCSLLKLVIGNQDNGEEWNIIVSVAPFVEKLDIESQDKMSLTSECIKNGISYGEVFERNRDYFIERLNTGILANLNLDQQRTVTRYCLCTAVPRDIFVSSVLEAGVDVEEQDNSSDFYNLAMSMFLSNAPLKEEASQAVDSGESRESVFATLSTDFMVPISMIANGSSYELHDLRASNVNDDIYGDFEGSD